MKAMTLGAHQRGASVTTVVLLIIAIALLGQLAVAIVPAYIGDYQLNKLIHKELVRANEAKASEKQFRDNLATQLSINANHNTKIEDVLVVTNKTPGALAVQTGYVEESNFYGNTFIVNRFSATINSQGINKIPYKAQENKSKLSLR